MKIPFGALLLIFIFTFPCKAQTADTTKIQAILKRAKENESINLHDAQVLYTQAVTLSREYKTRSTEFTAWIGIASVKRTVSDFDGALRAADSARILALAEGDRQRTGEAIMLTGDINQTLSDFPTAIKCYQQAEKYLPPAQQGKLANSMIDLFDRVGNVKASREYGYKAIRMSAQLGDTATWILAHMNLFSSKDDTLLAKGYTLLRRALPYAVKGKYTPSVIRIYHNLGIYYYFVDDYDSAIFNAEQSFRYMKPPFDTDQNLAFNYLLQSNCYLYRGDARRKKLPAQAHHDFETAKRFGLLAVTHGERSKNITALKSAYKALAQAEEQLKDYKPAIDIYKKFIDLNDSVTSLRNAELADRMEARYQNEKKQKEIRELELVRTQQNAAIRTRNILITVSGIVVCLLVILGALFMRNVRDKQKLSAQREELQRQKIVELKKDKELTLANAVVRSQEEERSRIAKDLHDGVGGMLSGIKLSLTTMKGNLIMPQDQVHVFERSLDMLDHSMKELRQVAHNLMPETLVKFGLPAALKDFADFVNQANSVRLIFQQVGDEKRLDGNFELLLYRVVNELINNALKHAQASEIIIQLHYEAQSLTITVEDNGKGFDKEILLQTTGAGWPNIKSRVDYLKGTIDVNSGPGQGTAVSITLPI